MKKEKRENGWDEIKTTCVRFDGFVDTAFQMCGGWVDYVEKYNPTSDRGRKSCQFCGARWEDKDPDEQTALVQTTKGNKVLCLDCIDNFGLESSFKTGEAADEQE